MGSIAALADRWLYIYWETGSMDNLDGKMDVM